MKNLKPSHSPSKCFEDLSKTKRATIELTEADLGQVSGGYPDIKRIVAQTIIGK